MNIWLLFNFDRKRNRNRNLDNFKKKRGGEREREANEVIFSAGVEIDIFFFLLILQRPYDFQKSWQIYVFFKE